MPTYVKKLFFAPLAVCLSLSAASQGGEGTFGRGRQERDATRQHAQHPRLQAHDRPLRWHRQVGGGGAAHRWGAQLQEGEWELIGNKFN